MERGRYEDAVASGTAPRGLHVLAGRYCDLQSADGCCNLRLAYILCYFIRNRRWAYGFCSGFTRGEYHIALVDFICSLRGHQRMEEMDSAEPLSSILWTPPPHPRGIRCGGALLLPRAYRDIGFRYPVQVAYPQFRIWFGCLCSGWYRSRFSRVVGLWSFVFHCWWDRLYVPAATWRFAVDMRRITANRDISSNFVWCKPISPIMPGAKML